MQFTGLYNGKAWYAAPITPSHAAPPNSYLSVYYNGTQWVAAHTINLPTLPVPTINQVQTNPDAGVGIYPPTTNNWNLTGELPYGAITLFINSSLDFNNFCTPLCMTQIAPDDVIEQSLLYPTLAIVDGKRLYQGTLLSTGVFPDAPVAVYWSIVFNRWLMVVNYNTPSEAVYSYLPVDSVLPIGNWIDDTGTVYKEGNGLVVTTINCDVEIPTCFCNKIYLPDGVPSADITKEFVSCSGTTQTIRLRIPDPGIPQLVYIGLCLDSVISSTYVAPFQSAPISMSNCGNTITPTLSCPNLISEAVGS
jgi:hypothetical protein